MVYVTGDTHGDIQKVNIKLIRKLKKSDTVIICGDFGFIWDKSKQEEKNLKALSKFKCTILFVDGCHENFNYLKEYDDVDILGSKAKKIEKNIYMLIRGGIYTIEDINILAIGGGQSEDFSIRIDNDVWDERELLLPSDIDKAKMNLSKFGNNVDYIISHEAPIKIKEFLDMNDNFSSSATNYLLQEICDSSQFKKWYFGHYHIDKVFVNKYFSVYNNVLKISGGKV